jgi:hypothetical protein
MKKLTILLVIMLFSAGMALAQSSEAYISQSGAATSDIFLTQSSGAFADIMQTGSASADNLVRGIGQLDAFSNASSMYVDQESGFGTNVKGNDGNELRIMQYGSGHEFRLDQHNSGFAKVEQRGANNSTDLQQYSGAQEADIYQSDRGNTVGLLQNEKSTVTGISSSYANISQTGRFNTVEGNPAGPYPWKGAQKGDGNELYLDQTGNNNTLQIYQFGDGMMNLVDLMQSTNGNLTQVSQTGGNNTLVLTQ